MLCAEKYLLNFADNIVVIDKSPVDAGGKSSLLFFLTNLSAPSYRLIKSLTDSTEGQRWYSNSSFAWINHGNNSKNTIRMPHVINLIVLTVALVSY